MTMAESKEAQKPKVKRKEIAVININEEWCKGCDICVQICAKDCLRLNKWSKVEIIDLEACNKCMLCEILCPDFAIAVR